MSGGYKEEKVYLYYLNFISLVIARLASHLVEEQKIELVLEVYKLYNID